MRTRLSSNQLVLKIVLIPFLVIMIACTISSMQFLTFIIALPTIALAIYITFFTGKHIEFDDEYFYIKKRNGEQKIDLKDVYYIRRWGHFSFGLGQIEYYSEGTEKIVKFHPQLLTLTYSKFRDAVLSKNPKARDANNWFNSLHYPYNSKDKNY